MKYRYAESIGIKECDTGYDTEVEAILYFYIEKRNDLTNEINKYEKIIQKIKRELSKLETKYGSIKELFPEEFI